MYTVSEYGHMIADNVSMDTYTEALRKSVTPNSVVLDIGTGTGILSLLACKFGARQVYAVEVSNAIHVAREAAKDNGYDDRIRFYQALSTDIDLPESADIIISDLRGVLSLYGSHIPSIVDARQRFLAPGGQLIPQSDTLRVAIVEAPEIYKGFHRPWSDNMLGIDFSATQKYTLNTWESGRFTADQLLAPPACWAEIDFTTIENPNVGTEISWKVTRTGTAHGFNVWFDTTLIDGVGFTNTPGVKNHPSVYGSGFFPLLHPVKVNEGDQVFLGLYANLINGEYIWCWNTRIVEPHCPGKYKIDSKQSTLFSEPLTLDQLRKKDSEFTPKLKTDGEVKKLILSLMDGTLSLEEICHHISEQFPDRYTNWLDALPDVGDNSIKYSR